MITMTNTYKLYIKTTTKKIRAEVDSKRHKMLTNVWHQCIKNKVILWNQGTEPIDVGGGACLLNVDYNLMDWTQVFEIYLARELLKWTWDIITKKEK